VTVARRLGHEMVVLPDTDHNMSTEGAQDRMRRLITDTLAATRR